MGMKYSYDEEGLTFYYFVLTLVGLYVIPTTFRLIWPSSNERFKDRVNCTCDSCATKKRRRAVLKAAYGAKFGWIKHFVLVAAWCVFAWSLHSVYHKSQGAHAYDPFEVLGVSPGANEKNIKRAFRLLSLKWHPDKAKDEKSKEQANLKFVEINKAYKTLTDPVSRKNWEEHGNPDGPTTFSLGIALPSWLVDSNNAFFVLALYAMGFGLLVPWLVSRSWSGSKNYTKDKILHTTMALFYHELKPVMSMKQIIQIVSLAHEYAAEHFNWATPVSAEETDRIVAFVSDAQKEGDRFERPKRMENHLAVRVYALLHAHLHRIPLSEARWETDQVRVVAKAVQLAAAGLLKIALVREWTPVALNGLTAVQFLTQACWENQSPLLQLPHMTEDNLKAFQRDMKKTRTIREFLEAPEGERRKALSMLSDAQYGNVLRVARAYPDVNVLDVSFKILGQDVITPDGVVTCLVKLKLSSMEEALKLDLAKEAEKARKETVEVEQFDFDEDGNMVESTKQHGPASVKSATSIADQPIHAPFFAHEKKPLWWVILLSSDMSTFLTTPVKIADLVDEKTVTLQFPVPPRVGPVSLRLLVRSDCLYGADIMMEAKFTVVKESAATKVTDSDWDISDTDSVDESPFGQDD